MNCNYSLNILHFRSSPCVETIHIGYYHNVYVAMSSTAAERSFRNLQSISVWPLVVYGARLSHVDSSLGRSLVGASL